MLVPMNDGGTKSKKKEIMKHDRCRSVEVKGTKVKDNLRMFVAYSSTLKVDELQSNQLI